MGCGQSKEKLPPSAKDRGINVAAGSRFTGAPKARVATRGIHPDAAGIEEKKQPKKLVRITSGAVLTHADPKENVEVLFFYPEFSAIEGKTPCPFVSGSRRVPLRPCDYKSQAQLKKEKEAKETKAKHADPAVNNKKKDESLLGKLNAVADSAISKVEAATGADLVKEAIAGDVSVWDANAASAADPKAKGAFVKRYLVVEDGEVRQFAEKPADDKAAPASTRNVRDATLHMNPSTKDHREVDEHAGDVFLMLQATADGKLLLKFDDEDTKDAWENCLKQWAAKVEVGDVPLQWPEGDEPHNGRWDAVVCQLKEFDSLDDVVKPWVDEGDRVPGCFLLESAGPAGAWSVLAPHCYQQRWVLPAGGRTSGFADDAASFPSRVLKAYQEAEGEKYLRAMLQALDDGIKAAGNAKELVSEAAGKAAKYLEPADAGEAGDVLDQAKAAAAAGKAKVAALLGDNWEAFLQKIKGTGLAIEDILKKLLAEMTPERMGAYETVNQLPDELGVLRTMLAFFEDLVLYNWFEIGLHAETEVATCYFEKTGEKAEVLQFKSCFYDKVMRKALDKAEAMADDTMEHFKDMFRKLSSVLLMTLFGAKTNKIYKNAAERAKDAAPMTPRSLKAAEQVDKLFPDFQGIVNLDLSSIDAELIGVCSRLPDATHPQDDKKMKELLDKWRAEDAAPVEERRQKHYDAVAKKFEEMGKNAKTDDDWWNMFVASRYPQIMPRHFYSFKIYLLFPAYDETQGANMRKPEMATLRIWPEGCPALTEEIMMDEFEIPNGGGKGSENLLAAAAGEIMDEGDDDIDEDDPRKRWPEYPNKNFRGFKADVFVAVDVNYSFNFNMDGLIMLDHNSWKSAKSLEKREYFRRVRFTAQSSPFTFNPLIPLGLAM